jgi:general secretion pathway protein I
MPLLAKQMVKLQINSCSKRKQGLTLIEVLIALAIVGIAMLAVIKASSQSIRSTTHVQQKTIALWVAQQALNEVRVGVIKLSGLDTINQKTEMLGQYWYTQIRQISTPNKRIMNVTVRVFDHDDYDTDDTPLIEMETYLYHA